MTAFAGVGAAGVRVRSWQVSFRWDGWGVGLPVGRVGVVTLGRVTR